MFFVKKKFKKLPRSLSVVTNHSSILKSLIQDYSPQKSTSFNSFHFLLHYNYLVEYFLQSSLTVFFKENELNFSSLKTFKKTFSLRKKSDLLLALEKEKQNKSLSFSEDIKVLGVLFEIWVIGTQRSIIKDITGYLNPGEFYFDNFNFLLIELIEIQKQDLTKLYQKIEFLEKRPDLINKNSLNEILLIYSEKLTLLVEIIWFRKNLIRFFFANTNSTMAFPLLHLILLYDSALFLLIISFKEIIELFSETFKTNKYL